MGTATEELVKEKTLFRRVLDTADLVIRKDGNRRTLTFSASSETPVDRWYGSEVLSHDKKAVRLDRAKRGAMPLLFNHNIDDPIGMIHPSVTIEDGRMVVEATLFETDRTQQVAAMIDGGLRNVSLAYRIYVVEEDKKSETFTVTDWEPYEVSIVTVPADPTVGIGRGVETEYEVRMVRTQPATTPKEDRMPEGDVMDAPAGDAAGTKVTDVRVIGKQIADVRGEVERKSAQDMEKIRRSAIDNLCQMNKGMFTEDQRNFWITSGWDLDRISKDMVEIIKSRTESGELRSAAELGLTPKEKERYSILRAMRALESKTFKNASFELRCHEDLANKLNRPTDGKTLLVPYDVLERGIDPSLLSKRDLNIAGTGTYLVATDNVGFIDLYRNRSVAFRMGATRLSGLNGNLTIPRQSAAETAYWLNSETATLTESQMTLQQVSLSPKTVGAYCQVSRQLMLQSSPSAEALVTSSLARTVATAADVAVLRGDPSGSSGQPQGIVGTTGVGAFTGTSLAAPGVLDAIADVAAANVEPMRPGFVTTAAVAALLMDRAELTTQGTTRLWKGSMWDGSLFDLPAMSSAQMASATMLFGDWSEVIVAEWGVLELMINPFDTFLAGIVGVRALYSFDVGVRHPAAFSYASSIT